MGQTVLTRDRNVSIIYQGARKELFTEPYWQSLKRQDRSNGIASWYKFTENFCKCNANQAISAFDQNWLKWRIRVNLYFRDWHLSRIFQSRKIIENKMKIQRNLNHMCFWQKLIIFLKKKIWVSPYCPWLKFIQNDVNREKIQLLMKI